MSCTIVRGHDLSALTTSIYDAILSLGWHSLANEVAISGNRGGIRYRNEMTITWRLRTWLGGRAAPSTSMLSSSAE